MRTTGTLPRTELGCRLDEVQTSIVCLCDTHRCNGLSMVALLSKCHLGTIHCMSPERFTVPHLQIWHCICHWMGTSWTTLEWVVMERSRVATQLPPSRAWSERSIALPSSQGQSVYRSHHLPSHPLAALTAPQLLLCLKLLSLSLTNELPSLAKVKVSEDKVPY